MALNKFSNEKRIMSFFLVASIIVFGLSVWFLLSSMKADEIGGSFISAMLLFISGYALIVFSLRLIRYKFLTKLQKAVLIDGVRSVEVLHESLGKSKDKINRELQFMVNSGYLEDFNVRDEEVIFSESEENEQLERKFALKQAEQLIKLKEEKASKQANPKKQVIKSQKCPNCGAKVNFDNKNEVVCPYCGNNLTR